MDESTLIFSKMYRDVATPILGRTLEKGAKLIDKLKSDFSIEGQELTFLCPENREKWSIVFQSKKGLLGGRQKFLWPNIRKVSVVYLRGLKDVTSKCINLLQGEGFELVYRNLESDAPYILDVESDIESPMLIDKLVHKKVQEDTLHEHRKYWMHAQLKFIDFFEKVFSNIRFEDLNFDVLVSTHEDVRTVVPASFKKELEVIVRWMRETDRQQKMRLSDDHLRLLRTRRGGKIRGEAILELLQELQDIFLPKTFRTFLKVERDFYYHDCIRGADFYTAPFPTWPKFMTVVTRTSLNLDRPAAEGYLYFNYNDFRNKIEGLFKRLL